MLVWSLGWEDSLEEGMATHSSNLAWRIPWAEESSRLQSIGSQRVRHDWSDLACMYVRFIPALKSNDSQTTKAPDAANRTHLRKCQCYKSWISLCLHTVKSCDLLVYVYHDISLTQCLCLFNFGGLYHLLNSKKDIKIHWCPPIFQAFSLCWLIWSLKQWIKTDII